jgi:hypothetical protein
MNDTWKLRLSGFFQSRENDNGNTNETKYFVKNKSNFHAKKGRPINVLDVGCDALQNYSPN